MSVLRGDETELFRTYNGQLLRIVRSLVVAPEAVIEDACSTAWEQFIRHQPARGPALLGWLRTVAVREVWKLSTIQQRQPSLEDVVDPESMGGSRGETWQAVIPGGAATEPCVEAKEALVVLAELPDRQRRFLTLVVGGYAYAEIMRVTGASYTSVNKHLSCARANVRAAELVA
jgi:DNA-directed RNA polymerase specialized sigma24 family protein